MGLILSYMPHKPLDLDYEEKLKKSRGYRIIAGIDEVGRGPLAGPVAAGAFIFLEPPKKDNLKFLRDSKLLSAKQREELCKYFQELKKDGSVDFSVAAVSSKAIDKAGIHHAAAAAMRKAVDKLTTTPDYAVIDGFKYPHKILTRIDYTSFSKADNIVPSCAAASVVAKVARDKAMLRYHEKYPQYRFDLHKGYGTQLHYKMLQEHGPSPIHRISFRLS